METNRKRKGGMMKVKSVMAFYRAAKPSSTTASTMQYTSQAPPPGVSSVSYLVNSQDYVISQPKPKVSFIVPTTENGRETFGFGRVVDNSLGGAGDDVDVKAANYISSVQERFRLERMNSERKMYQDMQEA